MIKKSIALCIGLMILCVAHASAQAPEKPYHFSIGPQIYYHEYEEPGIMKNKGMFYGLSYDFSYENRIYLGVEGLLAYGQVDYSSNSTGESDDIDDICSETRGIIGWVTYRTDQIKIMPYTGIAYRFLQDDSENKLTSTRHIGYLRESNYYYSPVGIRMAIDMGNGWRFEPEIEYDLFWAGVQESYLGYLSGYEDIENDQEDGYGYRLGVAFTKKTRNLAFSLQLFYRYWDIDRSEVTTDRWGRNWIEPANETAEYGLNFTFRF